MDINKRIKRIVHNRHKNQFNTLKIWGKNGNDRQKFLLGQVTHKIIKWPHIILDTKKLPHLLTNLKTNIKIDEIADFSQQNTILESLNWQTTNSTHAKLKKYYQKNKPFHWFALADSVSTKTENNHTHGYLLLDQIVDASKLPSKPAAIIDTRFYNCLIDKHMWLAVSHIKYFGNKEKEKIAQGNIIEGESLIKRYYSGNTVKYGLGTTKIIHSGIYLCSDITQHQYYNELVNPYFTEDYYRKFNLLTLTYNNDYKIKLNRFREKNLWQLDSLHKHVNYVWSTNKQIDYSLRFMGNTNDFDNLRKAIKHAKNAPDTLDSYGKELATMYNHNLKPLNDIDDNENSNQNIFEQVNKIKKLKKGTNFNEN